MFAQIRPEDGRVEVHQPHTQAVDDAPIDMGSPGWLASPSITSSIPRSRPANANGGCPNVGVNGFLLLGGMLGSDHRVAAW